MADDMIGYEQLMQDALRSVVRAALQEAASPRGLPGKRLGPFLLGPGGEFTLPALVLEDPAAVVLPRGTSPNLVTCSVRTERQGIRVQSPEIETYLPARLLCPPGVLDIRLVSGEQTLAEASLALEAGQEAPFAPEWQH